MSGIAHGSPDGPKKIFGKENVNWAGPRAALNKEDRDTNSTAAAGDFSSQPPTDVQEDAQDASDATYDHISEQVAPIFNTPGFSVYDRENHTYLGAEEIAEKVSLHVEEGYPDAVSGLHNSPDDQFLAVQQLRADATDQVYDNLDIRYVSDSGDPIYDKAATQAVYANTSNSLLDESLNQDPSSVIIPMHEINMAKGGGLSFELDDIRSQEEEGSLVSDAEYEAAARDVATQLAFDKPATEMAVDDYTEMIMEDLEGSGELDDLSDRTRMELYDNIHNDISMNTINKSTIQRAVFNTMMDSDNAGEYAKNFSYENWTDAMVRATEENDGADVMEHLDNARDAEASRRENM